VYLGTAELRKARKKTDIRCNRNLVRFALIILWQRLKIAED
jgi:hypothetical protein